MEDDLEPIELEPVDLEPADDGSRFERDRRPGPGPRRLWVGGIAAGLLAWAVIALVAGGSRPHPAVTPTSASASTLPIAPFVPPPDRPTVSAAVLRAELQDVGVGRFAAVINDQLYVLDENRSHETLVRLPEGDVTIDGQNGQLLLASTFEQTIVSTEPVATRTLGARDFAIPAWTPARWWILNSDGTIRPDGVSSRVAIPDGLRVAAAVADGFVALDVVNSRWVLWTGPTRQRIAPAGDQLLVTGPETIVFKKDCGYDGCSVEILDLVHGSTTETRLPRIPNFAALSPDGTRLALSSTQNDVFVIDTATGNSIVQTQSLESGSPSLPFTWTPDSRTLLVVQNNDIEIRRATDGRLTSVIRRTDGLQQLVALP